VNDKLKETIPPPLYRSLQVFSLDPDADIRMDSASLSRSIVQVPWESDLQAGPVGEYIEVVDYDPSSGCVYEAVDLNHPSLLAQNGYTPSLGNPQFHQQMVYAIAMKTIHNFEQVLGRTVLWSERQRDENNRIISSRDDVDLDKDPRYVQRLRIYPHALREENAYYSPAKKALLLGYFNSATEDPRQELPGGVVFTCLSHDIIAHETTHAILDGMHRRLLEPTNIDMLAFHEAFADIVAIFQHFSLPGLLLDQIQRTGGELRTNNLLARLASQFARATGAGDALRNALGNISPTGHQLPPDPTAIHSEKEPHRRGAILVAAVFDAFLKIYESRIADLKRIAANGVGLGDKGTNIHPDLAGRYADEAVKVAERVLKICIRALDYIPPVDVNFGDYLRGLITADSVAFPLDPKRYRLAFVEAFRDRGILPSDVRALGEDSLRWTKVDHDDMEALRWILPPPEILQTMAVAYRTDFVRRIRSRGRKPKTAESPERMAEEFLSSYWLSPTPAPRDSNQPVNARYLRYKTERKFAAFLHNWIEARIRHSTEDRKVTQSIGWHLGLDIERIRDRLLDKGRKNVDDGKLEVHAIRPTYRPSEDGRTKLELLVILTQSVYVKDEVTGEVRSFRGGCTLLIDPESGCVQYAIGKNNRSTSRRKRVFEFLRGSSELHLHLSHGSTELFAGLHRHNMDIEGY
jgi:hypothetical protein